MNSDLVSKIVGLMAGGTEDGAVTGAELAASLSREINECNQRLRVAMTLIEGGRYVQALAGASASPPLLELAPSLNSPELVAWRELCATRGWSMAPAVDQNSVERLKALENEANKKENLVKWYRIAAREKELSQSIWLLRRLVRLDPGDAGYQHDLKDHEQRYLEALRKRYDGAAKASDRQEIAAINAELNDVDWSIKIPADFAASVGRAVQDARRGAALADVERMIGQLGIAYSAMNINEGIKLVGEIDALISSHQLQLPKAIMTQYQEGRDWCRKEEKRRDDEAEFTRKLSELGEAVERSDAPRTDELLNELARHDRSIPETLTDRASLLVDNWNVARDRRRRRVSSIVIATLLISAITGLVLWRNYTTRNRAELIASELNGYVSSIDLSAYEKALSRLNAQEPGMLKHPVVMPFLNKDGEIRRRLDEKRVSFEATVEKIRIALTDEETMGDIDGLLGEAEALAHDGEQLAVVRKLNEDWSNLKNERRKDAQLIWSEWSSRMEESLASLESIIPDHNREEYAKLLEQANATLASHPAVPDFMTGDPLEPYSARIKKVEENLQLLTDQLGKINNAKDIGEYLDLLDVFVRAFPSDRRTSAMREILNMGKYYRDLMEGPANASAGNPFWGVLKVRKENIAQANADLWQEIKAQILDWENDERLVDMREYRYTKAGFTEPRISYIQGNYEQKDTIYHRVLVYDPEPGSRDKEPRFTMAEFGVTKWQHVQRMRYCTVLDRLVAEIKAVKADSAVEALIEQTILLFDHKDVPALLKSRVGGDLLAYIKRLAPPNDQEILSKTQEALEPFSDAMHWLCIGHPQYVTTSRQIDLAVAGIKSDLKNILTAREFRRVDLAVESRSPFLYAISDYHTNSLRRISAHASREYWVVRVTNNIPRIVICARVDEEGKMKVVTPRILGEPVFAPDGGRRSVDVINDLRKQGIDLPDARIKSESTWPVNVFE